MCLETLASTSELAGRAILNSKATNKKTQKCKNDSTTQRAERVSLQHERQKEKAEHLFKLSQESVHLATQSFCHYMYVQEQLQ